MSHYTRFFFFEGIPKSTSASSIIETSEFSSKETYQTTLTVLIAKSTSAPASQSTSERPSESQSITAEVSTQSQTASGTAQSSTPGGTNPSPTSGGTVLSTTADGGR